MEQIGWDQQIDALSVYRAFEQLEDGRHQRAVRYPLALIFTLIVLGKVAGVARPAATAEGAALRPQWVPGGLPRTRQNLPCVPGYSNVFPAGSVDLPREV